MKINYKQENQNYQKLLMQCKENHRFLKEQRKKEQWKRKQNLHLPEETESEVLFCTIQKDNLDIMDDPILFREKSYSFVNFINTKLGKQEVFSEDEMYITHSDFWCVDFTNCIFKNVKFVDCHFWGCKFEKCKTKGLGVIFENCMFSTPYYECSCDDEYEITQHSTEFMECRISGSKFKDCSLESVIWEKCQFKQDTFCECVMSKNIFSECGFYSVMFSNSDMANMALLALENADIEFYGNYSQSEFHESIYIDLMQCKIKGMDLTSEEKKVAKKKRALELTKMYYTLLKCLKSKNSNIDYLEEYRYQYHKNRMLSKEKWYQQIWDRISWAVCGFGERIGRFSVWFTLIIVLFALLYMFSGVQLGERKIDYSLFGGTSVSMTQQILDFGLCLHFSIVTLSTVGYGNITPLTHMSMFFCSAQILIGILLVAIFTSIVIKKLMRI